MNKVTKQEFEQSKYDDYPFSKIEVASALSACQTGLEPIALPVLNWIIAELNDGMCSDYGGTHE